MKEHHLINGTGKMKQCDKNGFYKPPIEEMQCWNIYQKIDHFYDVFEIFYNRMNSNVYGAFSGGKDSTVMMFLIDNFLKMTNRPPIKYVFNNTTNEHKEILDFVKSFGNKVHWIRPKQTFVQTIKKYGFPFISKSQAMAISRYKKTKNPDVKKFRLTGDRGDGVKRSVGVISKKWHFMIDAPFDVTDRCCDILKKEPVRRFEKETGLRPIVGTMADESMQRRLQYRKDGGCNVFKDGKEICKPLSIFTEEDIWMIIEKFKIDICPIYFDQTIDGELVTGESRTGCAYCGYGCHFEDPKNNRYTRLSKREPKRYLSMMDKIGMREPLNFYGIQLPDDEPKEGEQFSLIEQLTKGG